MQVGGSIDSIQEEADPARDQQLHQLRLQNASLRLDKQSLRNAIAGMHEQIAELNNLVET